LQNGTQCLYTPIHHNEDKHYTADCRAIAKFKQQKKARFEVKSGAGNKFLAFLFLFEEFNVFKRQMKSG
jgi:hypothetical protein